MSTTITDDSLRAEFDTWVRERAEAKQVLESESVLAYAVLRYLKAAKTASVSAAFRAGWEAALERGVSKNDR